MDNTTLETLEYPLILSELSRYAVTPFGRELVLALRPSIDVTEITDAFKELTEIIALDAQGRALPLSEIVDVKDCFKKVAVQGSSLTKEELIAIRDFLGLVSALLDIAKGDFSADYPLTSARLDALSEPAELYEELLRVFDDKGEIADKASPALYALRRELRSARSRAIKILDSIRGSKKFEGFFQEEFFTIRDDRYALAIKTGYHTRFPGVIHGRSSSGETYFIEPMEVVELNNRQAELKRDERAEEIRILKGLSLMVAKRAEELLDDIKQVAWFDFARARTEFSKELDLNIPSLSTSGAIRLKEARHPLLVLKEKRGELTVTPVDIIMEEGLSVLVISGANTGGKTVALKTLGLMTLMAESAIPIPAVASSEVKVFKKLFADIGDRQGIEESLSTFSAHIKRMGVFLENTAEDVLILIDEIGVGTDPTEGSVFALAVLEELKERGAVVAVTTHINLLKAHAEKDPAYMNASVIFNDSTMRASYKLSYGTPGPSLGLAIAESLGIPASLIERARDMLGTDEGAFIETLANLDDEKKRLAQIRERLEALEAKRDEAVESIRGDRAKIIAKIKQKADKVLKESEGKIEKALEEFTKKLEESGAAKGKKAAIQKEAREAIRDTLTSIYPEGKEAEEIYIPEVSDRVEIKGTMTKGVVVSVNAEEREAELLVGKLKVKAPFEKLKLRGGELGGKAKKVFTKARETTEIADLALSVNLLGMRVDEAISTVTAFLDNAHMNAQLSVQIIHGKGTGALKKAVRDFLGESKIVKSFDDAPISEGGAGVTIVVLK
jgi:DNA mismatch repair protein MutS2